EPVFEKAFDLAEYLKYSPALQEAYQNNLKVYRDNKNVLETARTEGEAKGFDAGKTEGRTERETEIARKLKQRGIDHETIAETTGLSITDIEKL
ncbi:MAG: hypothetical protein LBU34_04260, partial [Planctomycetaceae bacterium]|nr:hypothetical protein [Planctomycetaceae bacterium]